MTLELKNWLNSINQTKKNLIDEDPSLEKEYAPYIINRCLSGEIDCILFANEMNQYHFLSKKMQYDFLLNSLRKKKRYSPWIRQDKIKDLDYVKRYYGYSNEKAKQALRILSKEQLTFIKSKFETGGKQ
ncbi:DNA polymerase [Synechococcus phage S-SRM01]|uniref:DNA polymerase n=1 Tax=Synechococcus phage S-SRM01 TaxID=2781608 RepID=A0A879R390_9CAUD|nr:DNA polymerase [Synechococcus phage S-SRM01]QPX48207.1 DNA polymerase [Synechococcus phage S-SRM01]